MATKAKETASKAKAPAKAAAGKGAAIKVTATANGYYGNKLRVPGEEFMIEKWADFSKNWMTTDEVEGADERFVATGGTDGVVGATVKPEDLTDEQKALFGISENDDRSRDKASNPADNPPAPDEDNK